MTTNDFVTALRAVATHMRKHRLDGTRTLSVDFNRHHDAVEVHAYDVDTFRAWHQTLKNVTAEAQLYSPDTVIVDITGAIPQETVRVRFYATTDREQDAFDALLPLLTEPASRKFEPIELPKILATGARAVGGDR